MAASERRWQFWIDVGGTFTDCLGRAPDGRPLHRKTLSSGTLLGIGKRAVSRPDALIDRARQGDPDDIWVGYTVRLETDSKHAMPPWQSVVRAFDRDIGMLVLTDSLPPGDLFHYTIVSGEPAPLVAIRYLTGSRLDQPLPSADVRLGTTRGTNALLTRSGARTALIVTRGFADLATIGYQDRPELFALDIRKPSPLYEAVYELDARIDAAGNEVVPLDRDRVESMMFRVKESGVESLAICLMHACVDPSHERQVGEVAREHGFQSVSLSHQVAAIRKLVPRIDTSCVDAYLNPVLRNYLHTFERAWGDEAKCSIRVMTSAGGLVSSDKFRGCDSILSGPAGGVVGFRAAALAAGYHRAIGFDMGGTSTDVSRCDDGVDREFETRKAGIRLHAPMLAIETVAAGGGSVCKFDGIKLTVGPLSAGANPGPACYGRGGPLTVTDVNLILGRIPADRFPFPLDRRAAEQQLDTILRQVHRASTPTMTSWQLAEGFLRVANTHMSQAIRSVSLAQGANPADYVLVAFGGAAPQHATGIAEDLGIHNVLIPADASLLSALGVGIAPVTRYLSETVARPYDDRALGLLATSWRNLEQQAVAEVAAEGIARNRIVSQRYASLRYRGVDAELTLPADEPDRLAEWFAREHQRRYGYCHTEKPVEVVSIHVEALGKSDIELPDAKWHEGDALTPQEKTEAWFGGQSISVPVVARCDAEPGQFLEGPALISDRDTVIVLEHGWRGCVLTDRQWLLTRNRSGMRQRPSRGEAAAHQPDPVMLEVFNRNFAAIAEQMGVTLRNLSTSVNVKERLDYSCALFDADGNLVVNAPHMPVHLGAMSETVKSVLAEVTDLMPGDVIVTNDPYAGGSHLPDVTVVTPVFGASAHDLRFLTASRAHHAEIGGITPGSMPPFSRTLEEEGVLLHHVRLVRGGQADWHGMERRLRQTRYPSRCVSDNISDMAAQVAANQQGSRDLTRLMDQYSWPVVASYMCHIQSAADRMARQAIARLPSEPSTFRDYLDDDTPIEVSVCRVGDRLKVDFARSGEIHRGNLNANRAIVTAAILYVLRCLINEDIPLNAGVLNSVDLDLPAGLLNPSAGPTPAQTPAVVGGNVETSQRVVDVLLGAVGVAAGSQGTMNNVLFGDATFGYYETICGGAGATVNGPGADAVHSHMTNTRITDPEILESRYPVRLWSFAIRRRSGGAGRHRGGDGVVREFEFLRQLELSLLTQRRTRRPYGVAGGSPGASGRNLLLRPGSPPQELAGTAQIKVGVGDRLRVETPGGGGWGSGDPFTDPLTETGRRDDD